MLSEYIDKTLNKEKGFYFDIGAGNGVSNNKTLYFETKGWEGVCCEPQQKLFNSLMKNRSSSNVNCAIQTENNWAHFIQNLGVTECYSGLKKYYTEQTRNMVDNEMKIKGGFYEEIIVKCHTLEKVLEAVNKTEIDYLCISTYGAEKEILKSINYDKIKINCISFLDIGDTEIIEFLYTKNFKKVIRLEGQLIMLNNNYINK